MIDSGNKEAALDQARVDLAFSLKKLGNVTHSSVEELNAKVQPIKDAVNIKQHFRNHFWKTSIACVGVGYYLARKKARPIRQLQHDINLIYSELKSSPRYAPALHERRERTLGTSSFMKPNELVVPLGVAMAKRLYGFFSDRREIARRENSESRESSPLH